MKSLSNSGMFGRKNHTYPSILLIQGTLHPTSHTALLLEEAGHVLFKKGIPFNILDLRNTDLDIYDGRAVDAYGAVTQKALQSVANSNILLFSVPAYAPQTPGALKNLINLASPSLADKRAGLICYSETGANYEASLDLIKHLSAQDVEILKPIIRATPDTFRDGEIFDDIIRQLIEELVEAALTPSKRVKKN